MLVKALASVIGIEDPFEPAKRCGLTTLFPVDADKDDETTIGLTIAFAKVSMLWVVLWYVSVLLTKLFLAKLLPPSSVQKENNSFYIGQKFTATLKVVLVSLIANMCLWASIGMPLPLRFKGGPAIEIAGMLFTSFEAADLLLGSIHGLMEFEYVIHHLLHIVLGMFIRGYCMGNYIAAVLMAQVAPLLSRMRCALQANDGPTHELLPNLHHLSPTIHRANHPLLPWTLVLCPTPLQIHRI